MDQCKLLKKLFYITIIFFFAFANFAFAEAKIPTIKNVKIEKQYKRLVEGYYPQIYGLNNLATQKIVNDKIKSFIADLGQEAFAKKLSIGLFYSISRLDNDFLSVKFETEANNIECTLAHPDNQIITFNYDLKNNKEVKLPDLFSNNFNYLQFIAKISIDNLIQQEQIDPLKNKDLYEWIKMGAMPKPDNYKNFLLTKDNLIIVFQYYQVGPRPLGAPEVVIPLAKMR